MKDITTLSGEHLKLLIESLIPEIRGAVRLCCSLHKHRVIAEEIDDLFSEIVILLMEQDYRRLRSFNDQRSSLRTWLKAVVTHHIFHHLRKRKIELSLDDVPIESTVYEIDHSDQLWRKQQMKLIEAAKEKLTTREQEMLALFFRDDAGAIDIAEQLGIKVDSVYRRKHALIKKLQGFLPPDMYSGSESKTLKKRL